MYKQHVFQKSEFSSYLRARLTNNIDTIKSQWNRARDSVQHDGSIANFTIVQAFISEVSDVFLDYYPVELDVTEKSTMEDMLRKIPINMFEDIFESADVEHRPLMWHIYLYMTDTRHADVNEIYNSRKKQVGNPEHPEQINWEKCQYNGMEMSIPQVLLNRKQSEKFDIKYEDGMEALKALNKYIGYVCVDDDTSTALEKRFDVWKTVWGNKNNLFKRFVVEQILTGHMEQVRIEHKILPPVQFDEQAFDENATVKYPGSFLHNAVCGRFNYPLKDALSEPGLYHDLNKIDVVMWKFIVDNCWETVNYTKIEDGSNEENNEKTWYTFRQEDSENNFMSTFEHFQPRYTEEATKTLCNLTKQELKNGDKDDLVFIAKLKRFLYLNNTYTYSLSAIINVSDFINTIILGHTMNLQENVVKMISEAQYRENTVAGLDEYVNATGAVKYDYDDDDDDVDEWEETKWEFQKMSNDTYKYVGKEKWPLGYMGAIDIHKLISLYDIYGKDGSLLNDHLNMSKEKPPG